MMPATPSAKTVRKPFSIPEACDAAPWNVTTEAAGAGAGAAGAAGAGALGAAGGGGGGAGAGPLELRTVLTSGTLTPTVLQA